MQQTFEAENRSDPEGNPAGGSATATGVEIEWQDGAFVETVIAICVNRLEYYQSGRFSCRENALAITKLQEALHWLYSRTRSREEREVEGTHAP